MNELYRNSPWSALLEELDIALVNSCRIIPLRKEIARLLFNQKLMKLERLYISTVTIFVVSN